MGALTAFFTATVGVVQNDFKKVVAVDQGPSPSRRHMHGESQLTLGSNSDSVTITYHGQKMVCISFR